MRLYHTVPKYLALASVLTLSACASAENQADLSASDPYEGFNRKIHETNVALDRTVLRPVAKGYDLVTPKVFRFLLSNGFNHLDLPGDFANYLLQGNIESAMETLGRFTINTVLGAGGFLDPATEFGLPRNETDFGITLGKSGVSEGSYWVLPILGPSTSRDGVGSVVDLAFKPTTYLGIFDSTIANILSIPYNAVKAVDARDRYGDLIDEILYESPDSYVTTRSIYLQRRRALIAGDEDAVDALPDIFEEN
jgi:phospholipid-binding lipoprotein MlaA